MADHRQASADGAAAGAHVAESAYVGEVARQLQMSVTTVTRWAKSGWLGAAITEAGERRFQAEPSPAVLPPTGDGRPLAG